MAKPTHDTGNERELLKRAIQAVAQETGLRLHTQRWQAHVDGAAVDAIVRIAPGERALVVAVKNWAQHANLGALINRVRQLPQDGLLAADYVNPRMADKLRREGVQFIDTAGNAYINQPPVYVYVTGHRPQALQTTPSKEGARRAFEPKGLMVVFAFLTHPDLVKAPYRDIAAKTGVAVGTVGLVINGLKAGGFVREIAATGDRYLIHCRKLLDRWVDNWPERLKPKQLVGEFITDDPAWWENLDIRRYEGYWGGEIAAAGYTDQLKPAVATVYVPEHARIALLRDARLRKATDRFGDGTAVQVYRPFWPPALDEFNPALNKGLVHPVLAYADLVATGDPRNLEAARRIYEERIAQSCGED